MLVLLVLVVAVVGLAGNLQRSATGRAVLALRSSPAAAATSGIDPVRTRLTVFAVSAALAGFGGALFALVNSPMTNVSAPPLLGIVWLAVAVTFGVRRPGGAVVAGLVYAALPPILGGIGGSWGRRGVHCPTPGGRSLPRPSSRLSCSVWGRSGWLANQTGCWPRSVTRFEPCVTGAPEPCHVPSPLPSCPRT